MQATQVNSGTVCSNSIDRLTNGLKAQPRHTSLSGRMRLIENYPVSWTDVERYVHRDPDHYHRKIIETNNVFQLLILTWLPGQKSPIHNHRGSQCVVRVLSGKAIETVYHPRADQTFSYSASSYVDGTTIGGEDADIHTLENSKASRQDLVTLHVYFPPLKQMDLFKVSDGQLVPAR